MLKLEDDMLRQVRHILTPTQVAKLVLILPEVNRNLERRIRRAAQAARGAPGVPPPRGEDDDGQEE